MDRIPIDLGGVAGLTTAGRVIQTGTADYTIEQTTYSASTVLSLASDAIQGYATVTTAGRLVEVATTAGTLQVTTYDASTSLALANDAVQGKSALTVATALARISSTSGTLETLSTVTATATSFAYGSGVVQSGGLDTTSKSFAEIYLTNGSTAQTIATGATYTKLTGFATNGQSNDLTAAASADQVTVTRTGIYKAHASVNGKANTAGVEMTFALFSGGSVESQVHGVETFDTQSAVYNVAFSGLVDVTSTGTAVDIRAAHDQGSAVEYTPSYLNLYLERIGDT